MGRRKAFPYDLESLCENRKQNGRSLHYATLRVGMTILWDH
jgi:hypothetical protein